MAQTTNDSSPETTQDKLKRYMLENSFVAGQCLPPEPQLARELGISRSRLREAISALQSQGIVESHHGKGTFVSRFGFEGVVSSLTFHISLESNANPHVVSHDLRELVAMRELMESALVAELVNDYRQADILALYAITTQMAQKAERGEEFMDLDWRFHTNLYRRSGNRMLLKLLDSFWLICHQVREANPPVEYLRQSAAEHRRLVDAIASGDPRAASAAMREHFVGLHRFELTHQGSPSASLS